MSNSNASLKLREDLRTLVAEIAEKDEIPDGATFKELGIDSMMGFLLVRYAIRLDINFSYLATFVQKTRQLAGPFNELVSGKNCSLPRCSRQQGLCQGARSAWRQVAGIGRPLDAAGIGARFLPEPLRRSVMAG